MCIIYGCNICVYEHMGPLGLDYPRRAILLYRRLKNNPQVEERSDECTDTPGATEARTGHEIWKKSDSWKQGLPRFPSS